MPYATRTAARVRSGRAPFPFMPTHPLPRPTDRAHDTDIEPARPAALRSVAVVSGPLRCTHRLYCPLCTVGRAVRPRYARCSRAAAAAWALRDTAVAVAAGLEAL